MEDYQFDDVNSNEPGMPASAPRFGGRNSNYADELFSQKITAKFRTFYVDLKQSGNGKFIKISEKSHGQKRTIMMDSEDVPALISALQELSKHL